MASQSYIARRIKSHFSPCARIIPTISARSCAILIAPASRRSLSDRNPHVQAIANIPAASAVFTSTGVSPTNATSSAFRFGIYSSSICNAGTALGFNGTSSRAPCTATNGASAKQCATDARTRCCVLLERTASFRPSDASSDNTLEAPGKGGLCVTPRSSSMACLRATACATASDVGAVPVARWSARSRRSVLPPPASLPYSEVSIGAWPSSDRTVLHACGVVVSGGGWWDVGVHAYRRY